MGKYGSKIRIKSISEVLLDENRDYKGMNQLYGWEIDPYNPTEGKYVKKNPISKKLAKSLNSYGVSLEDVKRWEQ
jgi:pilus assembly protein CpaF